MVKKLGKAKNLKTIEKRKELIKRTPKRTPRKTPRKTSRKTNVEQALIDNFVSLQKVLTNLSIRFEELSSNISKLLQLFEISAKTFIEKYSEKESDKESDKEMSKERSNDSEFLNKLDSLLDQNKTIAKGIMLMEEKIKSRKEENFYKDRNQLNSQFSERFKIQPLSRYRWE